MPTIKITQAVEVNDSQMAELLERRVFEQFRLSAKGYMFLSKKMLFMTNQSKTRVIILLPHPETGKSEELIFNDCPLEAALIHAAVTLRSLNQ